MGFVSRKTFNGSKLNVPGQGISSVKPGGDNKINQQKGNPGNSGLSK